jgi:predicted Zn-dependent protease
VILKGMMRFVESDDELALVVGHEIAHNALGHVRQHKVLMGVGMGFGVLLDITAAVLGANTQGGFTRLGAQLGSAVNQTFSQDFEMDADYMGLYLAQRAGFDVSRAADFWRRMAAEYPETIESSMTRTHPSSPERSAALTTAVLEIHRKLETGLALTPEKSE